MNGRNKIIISLVMSLVIFCSIFVVVVYYQLFNEDLLDDRVSPFVEIFIDEKSGPVPFEVNFSSLVFDTIGSVDYFWDFGDNATSSEVKPTHIYDQVGVYDCSLIVTDSDGDIGSDVVEIIVRGNEAPIVSITMPDLKPNRPLIPILRWKIISINYNGQNLRRIIDSKFFPQSLLNKGGFVSCYATASSPEGNEIVKYEWELSPPVYNKLNFKPVKKTYKFEGQNITIPLLYTYSEAPYDLTVKVTDSKGFVGTSTIKFEVQLDSKESSLRTMKNTLKSIRQEVWHNALKSMFGGPLGDLMFEEIFPLLPGFIGFKIAVIFVLFINRGVSPEMSDLVNISSDFLKNHSRIGNFVENIVNSIISQLDKRKQKSPDLALKIDKIIDFLELVLEQIGLQNKRPVILFISPRDGSMDVSTNIPEVAITVKDPEGDLFNITIHGDYIYNISRINQKNDTFIAKLKTPLPNLTEIKWHVNISYSPNKWINQTYSFRTW